MFHSHYEKVWTNKTHQPGNPLIFAADRNLLIFHEESKSSSTFNLLKTNYLRLTKHEEKNVASFRGTKCFHWFVVTRFL